MSFQQIWVMWLDGNPSLGEEGWFGRKTFWWFKFPWWPFFGYFSKRLPYIGSNTCPVSQVLRKYAGNAFKATQQPRYPFYRAHAHLTSKRREPWLFDTAVLDKVRESVLTRYRLLPMWWLGTVRMPKVWSCETLKNSKMSMKALHLFNKKHATSHKFIWQNLYTYIHIYKWNCQFSLKQIEV